MSLKSKLLWCVGTFCLCLIVILGLLLYKKSTQPNEPIVIYNAVIPEQSAMTHTSDKTLTQKNSEVDETKDAFTLKDSDEPIDNETSKSVDTQLSNVEVDFRKNIVSYGFDDPVDSESEELFFNLTLTEIKEEIPVLEQEIRSNLTTAVELYEDLLSTDGMAGESPEIAAWRKETWNEVKQLVHDIADNGKILKYVSYLRVTDGENPMNPGGWISELMIPLPIQVRIVLYF